MKRQYKGILCITASAFCFTLMNLFVRLSGDLPSIQKSFFRNLVAFFFALAIMKKDRVPFTWEKKCTADMLIRAGFGTLGILCNFYAVDHLALSDASMLNKMSPFFVVLFSFLILKETIKMPQVLMIAGAFAGSLFVIKPTLSNLDLIPSMIGFLGGAGAGLAYTFVRKLSGRGVKSPVIVCFFSGFSCLVTLPFLIADYHAMSWLQIGTLLLAGLAAAGGQFGITAAYSFAPAREISIYDYSQIIFSAVLGFAVFGQIPDVSSCIGYVIILGMAGGMFFYNKKN